MYLCYIVQFSACFIHHKVCSRRCHLSQSHNVLPQRASCQIHKIAICACAGNAGNVFPHRRFRRKPLVSDPGMHHGTCVTHVPWCMSGSLTCGDGENVPSIPGACAPAILRIWQEAHSIYFEVILTLSNHISTWTVSFYGKPVCTVPLLSLITPSLYPLSVSFCPDIFRCHFLESRCSQRWKTSCTPVKIW